MHVFECQYGCLWKSWNIYRPNHIGWQREGKGFLIYRNVGYVMAWSWSDNNQSKIPNDGHQIGKDRKVG